MQCNRCKVDKADSEFAWRKTDVERHSVCKPCQKLYQRDWYERNKERHSSNARRIAQEQAPLRRAWLDAKKAQPCSDCGVQYPPIVMEFDHTSTDKIKDVTSMLYQGHSLKRIEAEIAKCELVCANCHRMRTLSRKAA